MRKSQFKVSITAALLCMSFALTPAQAATGVGKAIISIGKVLTTNKDGVEKKLKRRGKVFEGDTINVGKKSRLQLRFIDNQLVVLKANTVFRIDEYKFKDKNDKNKSAVVSLLKGGMRSVTGLIGKSARDKYKVKTPVATMGVRGTHYVLQICNGQCGDGVVGIVGTVLQGEIEMFNDTGSQLFGTDQFFNVPSMDQPPQTIVNPPPILISRAPPPEEGEGDAPPPGEGDAPPPPPPGDGTLADGGDPLPPPPDDGGPLPPPPDGGSGPGALPPPPINEPPMVPTIQGSPAPAGAVLAIAGITSSVDGAGSIVGVQGVNANIGLATIGMAANQAVGANISDQEGVVEYKITEGSVPVEVGGNGMIGVNWGRWQNSDIQFIDGSGGSSTLLTGLAFVYSPNATTPAQLAGLSSFQTYDLMGGPSIRDESGAILSGGASIDVDFSTQQIVDFYGGLSGNGRSYSFGATGSTSFSSLSAGGDIALDGICSGGACGGSTTLTGSATGTFVGPNAEGVIGTFGLNDGSGNVGVSGAGLFTPGGM